MANDIMRVTLKYRDTANNQFRNVFHLKTTTGVPVGAEDVESYVADIAPLIGVMHPTSVSLYAYEGHVLDATGRWQPLAKGSYPRAGDQAGDPLPYQAAAVALGYTEVAKTIGKKWIGPLVESHQSAGMLTEAAMTLLQAFCTFYTSNWTGFAAEYVPGTWSKLKGFHPFISGLCNQVIGSQRRRKPGLGI